MSSIKKLSLVLDLGYAIILQTTTEKMHRHLSISGIVKDDFLAESKLSFTTKLPS